MTALKSFLWPDEWEDALPAIQALAASICRRYRLDDATAADIIQLTILNVWRATWRPKPGETEIRQFPTVAALCGWAKTVVRSLMRDRWRKAANTHETPLVDPDLISTTDEPADHLYSYLELITDPDARRVVELRFRAEMSFREIARELKISTGQAHNLYKSAIEELARRLKS